MSFRTWYERNRDNPAIKECLPNYANEEAFVRVIESKVSGVEKLLGHKFDGPPNPSFDDKVVEYVRKTTAILHRGVSNGTRDTPSNLPPTDPEGEEDEVSQDGDTPVPGRVSPDQPPRYHGPSGKANEAFQDDSIDESFWGDGVHEEFGSGQRVQRGGRSRLPEPEFEFPVPGPNDPVLTKNKVLLPIATQPIAVHFDGGKNILVGCRKDDNWIAVYEERKNEDGELVGTSMLTTKRNRTYEFPGRDMIDFVIAYTQAVPIHWPASPKVVADDTKEG
jgi:hypothetical protein